MDYTVSFSYRDAGGKVVRNGIDADYIADSNPDAVNRARLFVRGVQHEVRMSGSPLVVTLDSVRLGKTFQQGTKVIWSRRVGS